MSNTNTSVEPPLKLLDIGETEYAPGATVLFHSEEGYLIHFVQTGTGLLTKKGKEYEVRPGRIFLLFPQEQADFRTDGDNSCHSFWLRIDGMTAESTLLQAGISRERPVTVCTDMNWIQRMMKILLQTGKPKTESGQQNEGGDRTRELLQTGYLYLILGKLSESLLKTDKPGTSEKDVNTVYINAAMQLLEDPMAKISEAAKVIGISRGYLNSIFKKETGLSPKEYQLRSRMEKARFLLETTEASVSEIGEQLGYADVFSFSKSFRRYFGISPSEYRGQGSF